VTLMGRISIVHVAAAIKKVRAMDMPKRVALAEEISKTQPHMLASCLVQTRMGVEAAAVDILLNILLVCYQAMKESGYQWPLISEQEQERHLQRLVGTVLFSQQIADPTSTAAAQAQYVSSYPEQPLLAYVINENNQWLAGLARRGRVRQILADGVRQPGELHSLCGSPGNTCLANRSPKYPYTAHEMVRKMKDRRT
jgi:hypothetical protein